MSEAPFRCGQVALIGRSNAGKSTLLNRLVGRKVAIVSPVPQTTRTLTLGIRNEPGAQLVFVDTPGVHLPKHALNRRMLLETTDALSGVDVAVVVVDASDRPGRGDEEALRLARQAGVAHLVVLSKVDLVGRKSKLLPLIERFAQAPEGVAPPTAVVPISSVDGTGLDGLLAEIGAQLPEGPALYPTDITTDQAERFLLAELIREKVLLATHAEVPHATTVLLDAVDESQGADGRRRLHVHATLGVEKDGQKGILIGKGGEMLKRIGTEARLDIERALSCSCHLALHVKVMPGWRDNPRVLAEVFRGARDVVAARDLPVLEEE